MNEREILELAAKAAGIGPIRGFDYGYGDRTMAVLVDVGRKQPYRWNPVLDDGDCARMEAAIGIDVSWSSVYAMADNLQLSDCMLAPYSAHNGNRQAARRWASTRAAAEIGREMP